MTKPRRSPAPETENCPNCKRFTELTFQKLGEGRFKVKCPECGFEVRGYAHQWARMARVWNEMVRKIQRVAKEHDKPKDGGIEDEIKHLEKELNHKVGDVS